MSLPPSTRHCLRLISVALVLLTLQACAHSPSAPLVIVPPLPPAPSTFGQPVPAPLPRVSEPAVSYAARTLGALAKANRRLINDRSFYRDVQASAPDAE